MGMSGRNRSSAVLWASSGTSPSPPQVGHWTVNTYVHLGQLMQCIGPCNPSHFPLFIFLPVLQIIALE